MPPSPLLLFFRILKEPSTKRTGTYQPWTRNMFIYRSWGSLGRGLKEKLPDGLQTRSFGPSAHRQKPHSCCQVWWRREPLAGLQRAVLQLEMCDCSQDPKQFREGGDPIRIFFIQPHRDRAFSKRPAVILCIREIKASPHSCLMLTDSWKNWLGVDLRGSFPSLLLYLFQSSHLPQPHASFQTLELNLFSFISIMISCPRVS